VTADDLKVRVEAFMNQINAKPYELADRLWVKRRARPQGGGDALQVHGPIGEHDECLQR
jgi:hypothetical protein